MIYLQDVYKRQGFTFSDINAGDMLWVIREAVDLYYNDKEAWRGLQRAGMTADFSWDHSAQEYLCLLYTS